MAIDDKFEPFSDEAIKAREKIVECMTKAWTNIVKYRSNALVQRTRGTQQKANRYIQKIAD
jgi:hypothetical protein